MTDTPKCRTFVPQKGYNDECGTCGVPCDQHPQYPAPVSPATLDFEKAEQVARETKGRDPWFYFAPAPGSGTRAALNAQHLAALEGVRKEERRKGFISGYVDRCKHRHFETTGFTCFASEVDAFEAEAVERWERLRALEARMEAE